MKKLPRRIIIIPPYNRKCLVLVGFRNLQERVRKYKMGRELIAEFSQDKLPTKLEDGLLCHDSKGRYILWIPSNKASKETIQHEAIHLIEFIHKYVGETGGREYRAYFPSWFYKEVRKVLR
jgi:hypothetical protein